VFAEIGARIPILVGIPIVDADALAKKELKTEEEIGERLSTKVG